MAKEDEMNFDTVHSELTDLARTMDSILAEVKLAKEVSVENRRTLRGHNGDEGLLTMVSGMRKDISTISDTLVKVNSKQKDMDIILSGDNKDDPGLVKRVKDTEKFVETIRKLGWIIIGALLANISITLWPKLALVMANMR